MLIRYLLFLLIFKYNFTNIEMFIKRYTFFYIKKRDNVEKIIKINNLKNRKRDLERVCHLGRRSRKGKIGILPSHQLLWFLASIYLDPGFEPLISQR